ncbi:DUF3592 domain-containing protein [Serratia rubidaea]|uniref:DUF3592 domain-containing protein n=1 Tax=Serratia rubidaea TaxID=61652 RepID=UPI0022B8B5EC|nr:DUF3592 domain-containing protein [Serratia rubidaea]WBF45538.1 hypothetical protein OLD77_00300 [Serratia rubidaea]
MNLSYFTTYPLLAISFIAMVFFVYALIRGGSGVKISPQDAVDTQGEIVSIRSSSGENSAFVNVLITVRFNTFDKKIITSEGRAVIDVTKLTEYKKGDSIPLTYSRLDPKKIKIKIKSPLDK